MVLEGIDGCGKSTQARMLAEWLRSEGYEVILTDEPTDGPIGRFIRKILNGEIRTSISAEVNLFAADRMWHLGNVILPALRDGKIVISERYVCSSIVYQTTRGASLKEILAANKFAPEPDLSILIDTPPEVSMRRMNKKLDEFEKDLKLQRSVRLRYLQLAKNGKLKLVNGTLSADEVQNEIRKLVQPMLRCLSA
ncbi:MAG: dTMP kinase [Candidatus Hadarchaeales archaeon]